jgi:peptidyl-prolyl cis-trans isomerase D
MAFWFAGGGISLSHAQTVIKDAVAEMSAEEMQATVDRWPANMRSAAADNPAVGRELATLSLVAKKIAQAADELTPGSHPEFYWDLKLQVQMLKRRMMVKHYLDNMEMPDLEPLAEERYAADKDTYAKVKERRLSSHILFMCTPAKCEYEDVNTLAEETLADLRNGADFALKVQQLSDDTVTKGRGGEFRWVILGQPGVSPEYTKGVFDIENVGDYSDLVRTKHGVHIIRLDGIEPEHYKPYEEVKGRIIAALEKEYRELAAIEFDREYAPVGDLELDEAALEAMLVPYKTPDVEDVSQADPVPSGGDRAGEEMPADSAGEGRAGAQ